jgi:hypothetical protein
MDENATTHSTGRDKLGKFVAGNKASAGNKATKPRAARFRTALLRSATVADMEKLARTLLDQAIGGNVQAIRLALAYLAGKPEEVEFAGRLSALERQLDRE